MPLEAEAGQTARKHPFERVSFSRQFLIICTVVLVAGMGIVGTWISRQIESSAVNRTASIAAVYVESILAAQLQGWRGGGVVDSPTQAVLDELFVRGPLRRKVLRFKLWDGDGRIAYSSDSAQTGLRFPVGGALAAAFKGTVQAKVSDLEDADNLREHMRWPRLLEVYVPLRFGANAEIVGVAEFYHSTENLGRDIHLAQRKSWLLVVASTLAIFLLLYGLVRRANNLIVEQRHDLQQQLEHLRALLEENDRMRERLSEAGARTTALNEQFLKRVAADIHDGPAQAIALAKMRFDELAETLGDPSLPAGRSVQDLAIMREALHVSLRDLRNIASGLAIPGIADLSLADTVWRAVRDSERRSGKSAEVQVDGEPGAAPLAVKITLYRVLQESMANSWKHASAEGPRVHVREADGHVLAEISDRGQGFNPEVAAASGRLGLAFMRERVRLLGGAFELDSTPGHGTHIRVRLPLTVKEPAHA